MRARVFRNGVKVVLALAVLYIIVVGFQRIDNLPDIVALIQPEYGQ